MDQKDLLVIADYSEESSISLHELCEICAISPEVVQQLIAYEIIVPVASKNQFSIVQLQRLQAALRLQRDLDMNLASVAIILDLLEELNVARKRSLFRPGT